MRIILCDNPECRKQLEVTDQNTITLNEHGVTYQVDLCDECCKDLMSKLQNIAKNHKYPSKIKTKKTDKKLKKTDDKDKTVEDKKVTEKENTNQTGGKLSKVEGLVEAYGIDKLLHRYRVEKIAVAKLAKEIGVSPTTLFKYLENHNIAKKVDTSKKVELVDIEAQSSDSELLRLMKSLEEKTNELPQACRTCGYKNKNNNTCWYTMVTNKQTRNTLTHCSHYVNIGKINND